LSAADCVASKDVGETALGDIDSPCGKPARSQLQRNCSSCCSFIGANKDQIKIS
jgi:hypothetical protein